MTVELTQPADGVRYIVQGPQGNCQLIPCGRTPSNGWEHNVASVMK
jgi:hypothetical protein